MNTTRDVAADYKVALIEEYGAYRRAGRDADAASVAQVLSEVYGYDVGAKPEKKVEPEPPVERAVPEPAETPETPEQPVKRGPGRPRKNPAD
jgi:hypothetical protein